MSHEQSITFDYDDDSGKHYVNVPTVIGGKKFSNKDAIQYHLDQMKKGTKYRTFSNEDEAVKAAKQHSHDEGIRLGKLKSKAQEKFTPIKPPVRQPVDRPVSLFKPIGRPVK